MKKYGNDKANNDPRWQILENLYEENFLKYKGDRQSVIPKKIHQIWLGSPLPERYVIWAESWKKYHPKWEYKLWTDDNLPQMKNADLFSKAHNYGMKSDILRYEILYQHGGLYIDTDFECLKPFDPLMFLKFFTGSAYDKEPIFYNGLIACIPKHPIMAECLNNIVIIKDTMESTGPYYFSRCFYSVLKEIDGVVAFPIDYFYPWKNTHRKEKDGRKYITDQSFALHHWEVSWTKK